MALPNPDELYRQVSTPDPDQLLQSVSGNTGGVLGKVKQVAAGLVPGGYFLTEPGRKFVSDTAGALKDYGMGAYQGGKELMRTEQDVRGMLDREGNLRPEYTQEQLEGALGQQSNALQAFTTETLEPTAMIVGGAVAPNIAIPAMIGMQAIEGYQGVEGTPLQKAGNAIRQATYGLLVDIATDPQLQQKFERNPARMATNTLMAAGQVAYPIAKGIGAVRGMKGKYTPNPDTLLNEIKTEEAPAQFAVSDSADYAGIKPETQGRVESLVKAYNREFPDDSITISDAARPQDAAYGSPTSWHKAGEAVDFVAPGLEASAEQRARFVELAKEHGFQEVLDEYSNPSAYATGGHVHVGGLGEVEPRIAKAQPQQEVSSVKTPTIEELFSEVERRTAERVNEAIEPVSPAVGLSLKVTNKTPREATLDLVKFSDPATEARWQEASKGVQKEPLYARVKQNVHSLINKATRVYEDLPSGAEFAPLKTDLLKLEKQKGVASDRTARLLQGITLDLDKPGMDLFTRKVVLDDLAQTKGELPFGLTEGTLPIEKAKIDAAIANNPKIAQAIETRRQIWDAVKQDYAKAMQDIGFDVSERISREDYFRHQVLEYANMRGISGTGQKLKSPTNRGFLRGREGSAKDINVNYLQAEFEVMAQMMHDVEIAKTIKAVENNYNIRDNLVKQYGKEWRENVPEGYTTWQPREGSSFYMANSIPEKLASKLYEGAMESVGLSKDQVGKVLAKGSPFKEFVVKEEVASTLNKVSEPPAEGALSKLGKAFVTPWKIWTLGAPHRLLKYELRNITGDLDAVITMNPRTLKKVPQAMRELYQTVYGERAMSPEMREWFKRGGMETTSMVQELPDINRLKMFDKFADKDPNIFRKAWTGYWGKVRRLNTFREGILRYAGYLDFLEQMKSNNGKPRTFAASRVDEIMALKDVRDRAFKLSNEMMGAYDSVSVLGKEIRKSLIPFWSWNETNFARYGQFFKNQVVDQKLASAVGAKILGTLAFRSPYYAYRVGVFAIKAGMVWATLQAYNMLRFPDEEKELPVEEQARPHIIFGRDQNGKVRYFSRLGAFGDFLEWFGMDTPAKDVRDYLNGDRTIKEIALDMVKSPVNKLVQGVSPLVKMPGELLTKEQLFPNAFEPRSIKDRSQYVADSFGLGKEFKGLSKVVPGMNPRPSKPYLNEDTIENFAMYKTEPNQASYYRIQDKKRKFLEKSGKGGEGDFSSKKSDALRNYKLSLRVKDTETAKFYLGEYAKAGGTSEGLQRSLESLDPLAGLNKDDKTRFVQSLNGEDKKELAKAMVYYKTVLLGKD